MVAHFVPGRASKRALHRTVQHVDVPWEDSQSATSVKGVRRSERSMFGA